MALGPGRVGVHNDTVTGPGAPGADSVAGMDGLTWTLVLIAYVLAVARITRLVNKDAVLDPVRVWLVRRLGAGSTLVYFTGCAWCVSTWVSLAAGAGVIAVTGVSWWWLALIAPAASHLTGLASALDPEDVEIVDD